MPNRSVVALALAALVLTSAPALADVPVTDGPICQFASVADPTAEPGSRSGELSGGPVLLTEQGGTTPETGTLTCRVQVNQGTHAGSGPFVSAHGTGVLTAGPGVINYTASDTDTVWLCSEFTDDSDGITYYFDDDTGDWSTDVNSSCGIAVGGTGDPSHEPTQVEILIDLIVCPIFAIVLPPEGDLVLPVAGAVWDCPPYGDTDPPPSLDEVGPPSEILILGIPGTGSALLVTPPGWTCDQPPGLVDLNGSVTCDLPVTGRAAVLTACTSVYAEAHLVPDGSSTMTVTSSCGGLSAAATAGPGQLNPRDEASASGHGHRRPVTCTWTHTGAALGGGGGCETNTGRTPLLLR